MENCVKEGVKPLTAENMAYAFNEQCPPDKGCRDALQEAFRLMRFYEFVDGETLDRFYSLRKGI